MNAEIVIGIVSGVVGLVVGAGGTAFRFGMHVGAFKQQLDRIDRKVDGLHEDLFGNGGKKPKFVRVEQCQWIERDARRELEALSGRLDRIEGAK